MSITTDVRVSHARVLFERFRFRTPLQLSTGKITEICQATAQVRVENRAGQSAAGYGAMFLGDLWAWPSRKVDSPRRVEVMQALCTDIASRLKEATARPAHPLVHSFEIHEKELPAWARRRGTAMDLPEPIPALASAVCFSPFDAALHDAFGRLHGVNSYAALSPEFLPSHLDAWLGDIGKGHHLTEFIRKTPTDRVIGWHVVSKSDALTFTEEKNPIDDGLPNSLEGWIEREGVFCIKVKTTGTEPGADVERTLDIHRVAIATHRHLNTDREIVLDVDCNEACSSAEPVLEYLRKLREASPEAYEALRFIEQPTSRDLAGKRLDMAAVSRLKPVLLDEGLDSLEALPLAAELGWSGAA